MKQSIADIKNNLALLEIDEIQGFIKEHQLDHRQGVVNLLKSAQKKIDNYNKELQRLLDMRKYENKYTQYEYICGIDEVGRGPLSGPVVCAAVILPKDCNILYVNDSKKVSAAMREKLYEEITHNAIAIGIGMVNPEVIDDINILNATKLAMIQAVQKLSVKPDVLLIDALTLPIEEIAQESIVKGDEKSISIAAASIIAKVTRDRMMIDYDQLFPEYLFGKNKGYGTKEHIEAIKKHGPCSIHRNSFIKNFI